MKKRLPRFLFVFALFLAIVVAPPQIFAADTAKKAPEKFTVSVSVDRPDQIYQMGEKVCFHIKVKSSLTGAVENGLLRYRLSEDGHKTLEEKTIPLSSNSITICGKMDEPGFMLLEVRYRSAEGQPETGRKLAGVGVSPEKIGRSLPVPDDFDKFWTDQKARLAAVPMEVIEMVPVDSGDENIEAFDIKISCAGGAPVSGYFARPKNLKQKSAPAVLWVHGAGVRSSSLAAAVRGAKWGALSMDINAHGILNGQPAKYYKDQNNGPLKDYRARVGNERESYYFVGMYLRIVRAIDFLTSQPQWDGRHMAVEGHSQGGGQSLVAGGLDPRVTFIAPGVPAMCDHSGNAAGRIAGWPKLVPLVDGKPDPKILEEARYVDAVNFASRVTCPTIMSVGFIDTTCPPTTDYAAFNSLGGPKEMVNMPKMGHSAPKYVKDAFYEAIQKHFKE
jgi:cephalosporin-C deacetylase